MQLIAIQDDVLVNPDKISVIERKVGRNNSITLRVTVDGNTYDITRTTNEFFSALSKAGVNLSKQFFSV